MPNDASDQDSVNPYAPTVNVAQADAGPSDVEAYRKTYLSHEASVKSIGFLYLLGSFFIIPVGLWIAAEQLANENPPGVTQTEDAVSALLSVSFGVFQVFVAIGLRRLQNWARVSSAIISLLGLIMVPVGTLISAYILYLLLSEKGRVVFSEQYKQVIEQTPHIRYRTSKVVWILLGLVLLLLSIALIGALFGS